MPVIAQSFSSVAQVIRNWAPTPRLIAIDGVPGSGKSTLRAHLVDFFSAHSVELDDFLVRDRGEFVGALRMGDLSAALSEQPGLVIVSGACMLQVLERLQSAPDVLVYVKRMARWGWADEDEVESDQLEMLSNSFGLNDSDLSLNHEVRLYHQKFRPQDKASIVFERIETD